MQEDYEMTDKKFLGWLSLGSFGAAVLILLFVAAALIFFPNALFFARANTQALFMISGVLGLLAAVLGFISRQTPQGKVGGIGGLVLSLAIVILLSFTLITRVDRQEGAVQPQSVGYVIRSRA
jgi:hypothetical protein